MMLATISHAHINAGATEEETDSDSEYESDSENEFPEQQMETHQGKFADLFRWLLILIFTWHIAHDISAAAVDEMLQYISNAVSTIESILMSPIAIGLSAFPASLYLGYKYLKLDSDKYVLCPKCHSLYAYSAMLKANQDGSYSVKRYTYVAFPKHPQQNRRLPCSTPLVKPVNLSSGSKKLYALHCYVSKNLSLSLQRTLIRKGIHLKLEAACT